jgi:hypothetical protein
MPTDTAVAVERFCKVPDARQLISWHHVITATDTHATIGELLLTAFSVRPILRLYQEDQRDKRTMTLRSPTTAKTLAMSGPTAGKTPAVFVVRWWPPA